MVIRRPIEPTSFRIGHQKGKTHGNIDCTDSGRKRSSISRRHRSDALPVSFREQQAGMDADIAKHLFQRLRPASADSFAHRVDSDRGKHARRRPAHDRLLHRPKSGDSIAAPFLYRHAPGTALRIIRFVDRGTASSALPAMPPDREFPETDRVGLSPFDYSKTDRRFGTVSDGFRGVYGLLFALAFRHEGRNRNLGGSADDKFKILPASRSGIRCRYRECRQE